MEAGAEATAVEAVAIFKTAGDLQDAIDDLMMSGFGRADLSLLSAEETVRAELGQRHRTAAKLEDDLPAPHTFDAERESVGDAEGAHVAGLLYAGALSTAGVIFAYGGGFAAAIFGAILGGGTGSLFGAVLARRVDGLYSHPIREHLAHGGMLLWVRVKDTRKLKRAVAILFEHSGRDVHVHVLPASS